MSRALMRMFNYLFPMCPRGGHRQRGELMEIANGRRYCWHPDCVRASGRDIKNSRIEKERHD